MSNIFDGLKAKLENEEWPALYMFKFVCPNDNETVAKVVAHFNEASEIDYRESKSAKYVSVTIKELMLTPESIISIYEEVAKIKGVISL